MASKVPGRKAKRSKRSERVNQIVKFPVEAISQQPKMVSVEDAVKMNFGKALEERDRLTIVFNAYHQSCCDEPFAISTRSADLLEHREQPYSRKLKAGPEWQVLNPAWLEGKCGLLVIENRSKLRSNASAEEKEEFKKKVLFLRVAGGEPWLIRPGRPHVGELRDPGLVEIRAEEGTVDFNLVVFPR